MNLLHLFNEFTFVRRASTKPISRRQYPCPRPIWVNSAQLPNSPRMVNVAHLEHGDIVLYYHERRFTRIPFRICLIIVIPVSLMAIVITLVCFIISSFGAGCLFVGHLVCLINGLPDECRVDRYDDAEESTSSHVERRIIEYA